MTLAANRPVLLDVTRLAERLGESAPNGLDRVDLAYLRHYLGTGSRNRAVVVTPFGPRLLPPARLDALREASEARVRESDGARPEVFRRVEAWLAGPPGPPPAAPPSSPPPSAVARWRRRLGWAESLRFERPAAAAPRGAAYLHVSHMRLDRTEAFDWLVDRPDVSGVFFIQDIIPIDFPEYVAPSAAERHRRRVATAAAHGAALLVSSDDVERRLGRHLASAGLRRPPITVAPLGIEPVFGSRDRSDTTAGRPYLVVLGTIEARKNHLVPLQAWRALAEAHGPDLPALVVIGSRGWEAEGALDMLDRCAAIRPHVIEVAGLPSAAVARLVAGARALLMPSFAEGYGLPVLEALGLGTPAIVSDLPVFREIAGGRDVTFVDPTDGPGWRAAVLAAAEPGRARPAPRPVPTWDAHFACVDALLASLP